jgi:hypothetical protein
VKKYLAFEITFRYNIKNSIVKDNEWEEYIMMFSKRAGGWWNSGKTSYRMQPRSCYPRKREIGLVTIP